MSNHQQSNPPIVFFGTDEFSIGVLNELVTAGYRPTFIITAPDRPAGRKQIITPPPIKQWAEQQNIDIWQPADLKGDRLKTTLAKLQPFHTGIFLVASYGLIIPQEIIDWPRYGSLNVHPSLLPRWRGPSPIQSTILYDDYAGVTIMQIDALMDHGPVVAQETVEFEPWPPSFPQLRDRLAKTGGQLLAQSMPDWLNGQIKPQPQTKSQVVYTTKIKKTDAELNPTDHPAINWRKIQAFKNWPRAHFFVSLNGQTVRVVITEAKYENGRLKIEQVIPAGKPPMSWSEFCRRWPETKNNLAFNEVD